MGGKHRQGCCRRPQPGHDRSGDGSGKGVQPTRRICPRITDIQVNPETLVITELDLADHVFDLRQTADKAQQVGLLSPEETQDCLNELQQLDQSQAFFCSFTGFIVSGKKR